MVYRQTGDGLTYWRRFGLFVLPNLAMFGNQLNLEDSGMLSMRSKLYKSLQKANSPKLLSAIMVNGSLKV